MVQQNFPCLNQNLVGLIKNFCWLDSNQTFCCSITKQFSQCRLSRNKICGKISLRKVYRARDYYKKTWWRRNVDGPEKRGKKGEKDMPGWSDYVYNASNNFHFMHAFIKRGCLLGALYFFTISNMKVGIT